MIIEYLPLKKINNSFHAEFQSAFDRVLQNGWFILGEEVKNFEFEFAKFCNTKHCIGVATGLDALVIILKSYLELGKLTVGDEVIIPSNTFIATALAVSSAGLTPVFVEPDLSTYNIEISSLKNIDLKRVKAVMPVHLYGRAVDMGPLIEFCQSENFLLIEDAAQAHGAFYNGKRVGSLGDAAGFSFYPGKNLGALGDAGAITANNDELAEMCRIIANYGAQIKYNHTVKGINSRLDEIHAAFLSIKLKNLDHDNSIRNTIAQRYLSEISNEQLILPPPAVDQNNAWHIFPIRCKKRDKLQKYLKNSGIMTQIHYPKPIYLQEAYKEANVQHSSQTIEMCNEIISIPLHQLLTEVEVSYIIEKLNKFIS